MQMATAALKLATLRERQARLLARISKLENQEKKQARREDTRLKILVGAGMLADAEFHPETLGLIRLVLGRAITAERDREFLRSKGWL
jgi:hypothetical protein